MRTRAVRPINEFLGLLGGGVLGVNLKIVSWRADVPWVMGWRRTSFGGSEGLGERRSVWVRRLIDLTVRAPRFLAWGLTIRVRGLDMRPSRSGSCEGSSEAVHA